MGQDQIFSPCGMRQISCNQKVMRVVIESYFDKLLSKRVIVIWMVSSIAMVLAGPFGTYDGLTIAERLVYWPSIIALSFVIGFAVRPLVLNLSPGLGSWPADFATSVLFTALFAPLLLLITRYMASVPDEQLMSPAMMAGICFSIPMATAALRQFLHSTHQATSAVGNREPSRLLRRLGEEANHIHHIGVRDHYVDVYSDIGRTSLLMRFSDALAEVEEAAGLRVHRSHWVAYRSIDGIERDGNRLFLRLTTGTQIPVSRNYRKQVETELGNRRS